MMKLKRNDYTNHVCNQLHVCVEALEEAITMFFREHEDLTEEDYGTLFDLVEEDDLYILAENTLLYSPAGINVYLTVTLIESLTIAKP